MLRLRLDWIAHDLMMTSAIVHVFISLCRYLFCGFQSSVATTSSSGTSLLQYTPIHQTVKHLPIFKLPIELSSEDPASVAVNFPGAMRGKVASDSE